MRCYHTKVKHLMLQWSSMVVLTFEGPCVGCQYRPLHGINHGYIQDSLYECGLLLP